VSDLSVSDRLATFKIGGGRSQPETHGYFRPSQGVLLGAFETNLISGSSASRYFISPLTLECLLMKYTIKNITLALSLAALTATSMSASAVDLRVIGTITPAACTPTLGGGGTIDYGTIHPTKLSATAYTVLPEMNTSFSITCTAPAKVAIVAKNGRIGSLAGATEGPTGVGSAPGVITLLGVPNIGVAGLGLDGTDKIGGYALALQPSSILADGVAVDSIQKNADWPTFTASNSGSLFNFAIDRHLSWAATGTLNPIALTNLTGQIRVQAYLNHSTELDLSKPVNLDGLTTIEMIYL
ncbi:DUF1120 domain-containing protein, partial [Pseudomonas sp. NPDC087612]|uniref:DUF1120 domain-containing protein n=1 Tax=Pseudomonas sp. NPDC087612 TaxID=3364441 RepID=UPI0038103BC1